MLGCDVWLTVYLVMLRSCSGRVKSKSELMFAAKGMQNDLLKVTGMHTFKGLVGKLRNSQNIPGEFFALLQV